jgi:hypothetical protein
MREEIPKGLPNIYICGCLITLWDQQMLALIIDQYSSAYIC